MNLLRSMCCLFGRRCAPEEAKSAGDTMRAEQSVPADLGQKEADLEKTGKEQMRHMEISQTWSQLAARTEAYEAMGLEWHESTPGHDKQSV